MLDAATGLSKGFGFVSFKCWQDAQKALDELKGAVSSVEGDDNKDPAERKVKRGLYVREAKTKEQRTIELQKSTYQFKKSMQLLNLVVKNVDPSTTKPEFEEFFGNFGQVNNSKLNTESQLGFVCFQDRESARNAKENAPRQLFKNRRLIVNFCEPRESRRISLEEQFDKRAYQRQRVMNVRSQNSDLLTLINSIGLLLNFSGNGV